MSIEASEVFRSFARTASRTPDDVAVCYRDRVWSYARLRDAAAAAAVYMAGKGVHAGDRVAFFGRNSDAYVIGFLATQLVGAVHVPVNFMLGAREVGYILDHAAPKVIFADADYMEIARESLKSARPAMHLLDLASLARPSDIPPVSDLGLRSPGVRPAQLAYTSGTESLPKGALLSDSGLVHEYVSCIEAGEYAASDVLVHALPLFHCAQMHCFLLPSLMLGAKNIILDRADPVEIAQTVRDNNATSFFAPPTVWIGILNSTGFRAEDLASLRKGYYGASIMPAEVLRALRQTMPWLRLWNYYGQTEIGPLASVLRPEEHDERPTSAGRPVLFVETRVVDDDMKDVQPGTVGEIVHRSPQLLMGYYRDPVKTKEAFTGGWFHSGDLAIRDEKGYLVIVDRKKDMIKTGGENVASREVEEVIYCHPAVNEVAVVGLPDSKWVERVCAVVVLRKGVKATETDIIEATASLAPFKRPKQIIFVNELPKNPSGKILKRDLRIKLNKQVSVTDALSS